MPKDVQSKSSAKPAQTSVEKVRSSEKQRISAPTLPGSMNFMLSDEDSEDKDLHSIRITFFKRNVQEAEFLVVKPDGSFYDWMGAVQYEDYKATHRAINKAKREVESANGWSKKLGLRCLIFPKQEKGKSTIEMMGISPVPKIVQGMMAYSQKEFPSKFPTPDAILDFWLTAKASDLAEVKAYADKIGEDFDATLEDFRKSREIREKKKTEKLTRQAEEKVKGASSVAKSTAPPPDLKVPPPQFLNYPKNEVEEEKLVTGIKRYLFDTTLTQSAKTKLLVGVRIFLKEAEIQEVLETLEVLGDTPEALQKLAEMIEAFKLASSTVTSH